MKIEIEKYNPGWIHSFDKFKKMKINPLILILLTGALAQCTSSGIPVKAQRYNALTVNTTIAPTLVVNGENTHDIVKAYRIAIGDIMGNIQYHQSGILKEKTPCLYAGLLYGKPWTRDAAINIWNGFGLLSPDVSKNTLLAQIEKDDTGKNMIAGQYWDKIIWTLGAWNDYLYSGDREFLKFAYQATQNTLQQLETEEFSQESGLFRGPAVYGDGVAAYPAIYTHHQSEDQTGSYSGIDQWAEVNEDLKYPKGHGLPMQVLSTNAVYYQAYRLLTRMAHELKEKPEKEWEEKAENLRKSINHHFWNESKHNYDYLIDSFGHCDAQESLGIAFCLLFDIADEEKVADIFKTTVVEPAGVPCVYPTFERYRNDTLDSYGRHSGTVWPHIQGFWADGAMKYQYHDIFLHEFNALTRHALRDFQFVEIYHPTRETPYGGIQEPYLKEWTEWFCAERQTWSATAYLRMIFQYMVAMKFSEQGVTFKPFVPDGINSMSLLGLRYRNSTLDIHITGTGTTIEHFFVNGLETGNFFIPADSNGKIAIEINLAGG